jgi:hypothetical protein
LAYSSTLKMEVICSSETLSFLRTTGDRTLHSHSCENLNSTVVCSY